MGAHMTPEEFRRYGKQVVDWVAELFGLPAHFRTDAGGGGVIQDSASSASLLAILAARHRAGGDGPHKWLLTNFDCTVLWVADREPLTGALSIQPEYLRNTATSSGSVVDYRRGPGLRAARAACARAGVLPSTVAVH